MILFKTKGSLIFYSVIVFAQAFVTNNERALEELYGDEEDSRKGVACLNVMAARVATVFASLRVHVVIECILIQDFSNLFIYFSEAPICL